MSVVSMQKVRLSLYRKDVDAALDVMQKAGAVEFLPTELEGVAKAKLEFPYAELFAKIQSAVQFLEPYAPKTSLWKKLREGTRQELTETELQKRMESLDVVVPLVEDFERLQIEFAEVNERLRQLEEHHQLLETWKDLPIKLSDFDTTTTKTLLFERKAHLEDTTLEEDLDKVMSGSEIPFCITAASDNRAALTIPSDEGVQSQVDAALAGLDVELVSAPDGVETPEVEITAVSEQLAKVKGELALLLDQAEHFAQTHIKQLQQSGEILSWQKERFDIVHEGSATEYTVVLDGWIKANHHRQAIENMLAEKGIAAVMTELELQDGEEPPVEIENNAIVKPFEAVTRLYGMPGHKDLDPTAYLAGFFFLFFGLSLTDVGYGLFLMIASTIVIALFKVTDATKVFASLLFFVGLATVAVGAIFGGYLGIAPDKLPTFLQQLAYFEPIENPLPVFYLALSLGVVQVMVGMVLKIYSEYKNGRLIGGIVEQGPWLFTFCMGILALFTSLDYVSILPMETVINLIYVGLALVAVSGAWRGEGIFGRVMSAAARLYDSIGYFSDILSYSRLLALGLATTALAFAVNLIAGMIYNEESIITWVFAGLILLVGHMFNLAVNTLGAFIHSARLQFVEFFGKFIVGTGREFSPLSRTEKHLVVKKD